MRMDKLDSTVPLHVVLSRWCLLAVKVAKKRKWINTHWCQHWTKSLSEKPCCHMVALPKKIICISEITRERFCTVWYTLLQKRFNKIFCNIWANKRYQKYVSFGIISISPLSWRWLWPCMMIHVMSLLYIGSRLLVNIVWVLWYKLSKVYVFFAVWQQPCSCTLQGPN